MWFTRLRAPAGLIVASVPSALRRPMPSARVTVYAGMSSAASPPPKLKLGGCSYGPEPPVTLFAMIAPTAPAFAALWTFMLTAHVPRSMSAILPTRGVSVHGEAPAAFVQPSLVDAFVVSYSSVADWKNGAADHG